MTKSNGSSPIVEVAAIVFLLIVVSLWLLVVLILPLTAPSREELNKQCRDHGGVEQIATSRVLKTSVMVVCKDGNVR